MPVLLWKDGESVLVSDSRKASRLLENGYVGSEEASLTTEKEEAWEDEDALRHAAKDAGIANYWNKKPETLKEELANVNQD